jgi:S-adenosylmethionine-dependent methyltransferase
MATETFDDVVTEWLAYQTSQMGRLRTELFWQGIQPHLPQPGCDALDVGGGSGELTEILARAGHTVTLLDNAQPMLDAAQARMCGLPITYVCAEAGTQHATPLHNSTFDLITCHSVIEFADDPRALLSQCRRWLKPNGILSLGFGNRRHGVLAAAIVHKDLPRALHDLHHPPNVINRLGKPLRVLEPDGVIGWLHDADFEIVAENGIRCVTDLVDKEMVNDANFGQVLHLEAQLMTMSAYKRIARFTQLIARRM